MSIYPFIKISFFAGALSIVFFINNCQGQPVQLHDVSVWQDTKTAGPVEIAAAGLLQAEIAKRTSLNWQLVQRLPEKGDIIILRVAALKISYPFQIPRDPAIGKAPESFRIVNTLYENRNLIIIEGIDERGLLYGVGKMLRMLDYGPAVAAFTRPPSISEQPNKTIRGHQLGYRNTANSYDAWSREQFEQYIRDLVVFGTNSIESIPIFDESVSPHFKVPPMEMNAFISRVCQKYGLDYWMWIPAQFDLNDTAKRRKYLATFEKICKESVRINGVFFPGGDPGDNPPQLVIPLLQDIAAVLKKYHPAARTWISLQGFTVAQSRYVYEYIREKMPSWLGGLITGPSSPTVEETRAALPRQYKLRHYPDLTHNVRCEFEIPWWDPAFSLTLGREAVNPRPTHYAAIYRAIDPYIDGFISYSDGIHDDVNKIIWTALSWDRRTDERTILKEYCNYFFGSPVAEKAADGILALEKNWQGPIATNGGISSTRDTWMLLEKENPLLDSNWRWQMNLLRANYDAYTRARFIYETGLEEDVNRRLTLAPITGAASAITDAGFILGRAETNPVLPAVRSRIVELCEALYRSIGLQTSVKKYQASGLERGAVLDFLDRPLNNRWWLEDEFTKIRSLTQEEQLRAVMRIANWERADPGSYYDEVGNIGKSVHEMKGEDWRMDPMLRKNLNPGYDFSDNGMSRKRLSWLTNMRWPISMEYTDIDSLSTYTVRVNGVGECLLKINGQRVAPSHYGREIGDVKEFPVPQSMLLSGKLVLTWDDLNEEFLNWRKQSKISEVWLIKD